MLVWILGKYEKVIAVGKKLSTEQIQALAQKYCDWADSDEGFATLRRRSEMATKQAQAMLERCQVPEEVLLKRYGPVGRQRW